MMISDAVVDAVADYIRGSGESSLDAATVYERDAGADLTYPAIVVREEGIPEEHEVIKGQWTVGVAVVLRTRPEGDEAASTHRAMAAALNCLMGDSDRLVAWLSGSLECHDSWGGQGMTEPEDGYRQTTFLTECMVSQPGL